MREGNNMKRNGLMGERRSGRAAEKDIDSTQTECWCVIENRGITCVLTYAECELLHLRDFLLLVACYRRRPCVFNSKFHNRLSSINAPNIGTLRSARARTHTHTHTHTHKYTTRNARTQKKNTQTHTHTHIHRPPSRRALGKKQDKKETRREAKDRSEGANAKEECSIQGEKC